MFLSLDKNLLLIKEKLFTARTSSEWEIVNIANFTSTVDKMRSAWFFGKS